MSTPTWHLTIKSEFCAAHALRNYKGKCERLHGHNYVVETVIGGHELTPDTEYLMDFKELKALVKDILSSLEHQHLNNIQPFDKINPSAENLARFIWQCVHARLPQHIHMVKVTVFERSIQAATYMEK